MIFASRRYVDQVELRERELRADYENRLRDKESEIRRLRGELATKGVRMEPETEPLITSERRDKWVADHAAYPSRAQGPLDWQGELSKLIQEEGDKTDGVPEL